MKDSHKAIWLKRKKLGRSKYLIMFGIVPWGIGAAILTTLLEYISFQSINSAWIPTRLIVFAFIGFFVANGRWVAMEHRFEPPAPRRP
ncbi:hypothetical protein GC096_24670 [Paenibacillus sp. LMG 31461]|jgi:hypothetical protein|uniref:Uncharacterized protein n=1 Tax=Paenibacillus plantarum TaxID=2654975 RepID=A0ABX1XFH1_9BACL|nr:hypothetical protein [Paenibacillus plantarum]NOU67242.1 hypothetical protein [Paenibacillus plantarum]